MVIRNIWKNVWVAQTEISFGAELFMWIFLTFNYSQRICDVIQGGIFENMKNNHFFTLAFIEIVLGYSGITWIVTLN